MPAPRQRVHVEDGRVGDLHEEDAVARYGADGLEVGLPRQRVEAVEHQADAGMIGTAHGLPGVAIVVDVAAPGQRLEADAQAAPACPLAELMEVRRGAVDAAEAFRRDVRAHQQKVAAQLLHQIEFALGAGKHALALVRRHALEVAERLEGDGLEPEVRDQLADAGGRAVERQQVVLEDLDALEAGSRDRVQLLGQAAAQRHRRNRQFHRHPLLSAGHWRRRRIARGERSCKGAVHALDIGGEPGEKPERLHGLVHAHAAARERSGALRLGGFDQLGLDRRVDDVGHPVVRSAAPRSAPDCPESPTCRSAWR